MTHPTLLFETPYGTVVDPAEYSDEDVRRTVANLDGWWSQLLDSDPGNATDLSARLASLSAAFASSIGRPGGLPEVAAALQEHGRTRSFFAVRGPSEGFLRAVLELVLAAGERARVRRVLAGPVEGSVAQLNVSTGGVPKLPVPAAEVGWRGLDGDRQATRTHHGRAWQAVCLWSAEVIAELQAQGHPIAAGSAGENVTVAGLDWSDVRPGARLAVGGCELEVSAYAVPCSKIAHWFADGASDRIHHERGPGVSRVYASVLRPGPVAAGDAVRCLAAAGS